MNGKDSLTKLNWLHRSNFLPLPTHQAYGSFYCVVRRVKTTENYKTKAVEQKLKRCVEKVEGNVILNWLEGKLLPENEVLPGAASSSGGNGATATTKATDAGKSN